FTYGLKAVPFKEPNLIRASLDDVLRKRRRKFKQIDGIQNRRHVYGQSRKTHGGGAEGREDNGVRPPIESRPSESAIPQARKGEGQAVRIGQSKQRRSSNRP